MIFTNNLDIARNQLLNAKLHVLSTPPSSEEAVIYYDSTKHSVGVYNGTEWKYLSDSAIESIVGTAPISVVTNNRIATVSISAATVSTAGSMSKDDKAKLDGIENNAKDDQVAIEVPFTPTTEISQTNVQAALAAVGLSLDTLNSALTAHENRTDNPHDVDKGQVGLGNVTNDLQLKNADKQTTVTNDDSKIPTGGAIVDYTYDKTVADQRRAWQAAGMTEAYSLVDNGNGTVNVAAGRANLYDNTVKSGFLTNYVIPASNNMAIAEGEYTFIVAEYNSGVPRYRATTNISEVNESDVVPMASIFRVGTDMDWFTWGNGANGMVNNLHARFVLTDRFKKQGSIALSETGTRNFVIGSGKVWIGGRNISLTSFDSNVTAAHFYYRTAPTVWSFADVNQFNNTQYDPGTGLQTLGNHDFTVNWIYRGVSVNSTAYIVLGNESFNTLDDAAQSNYPEDLPDVINRQAVPIGRIIIEKNNASADLVQTEFTAAFASIGVSDHESLSGIQGGEAGDHQHITTVEKGHFQAGYNHSLLTSGNPHNVTKSDVGLGNVDNVQQIPMTYLDTDPTMSANSDTKVPSQKAVKTYIDNAVDDTLKTPEAYNPTVTSQYPITYGGASVQKGDSFRITASGTMNGTKVNAEDLLIALIDNPGQTPSNWQIAESNRDQATETTKGVLEIATQTEANIGADHTKAITPLTLAGKLVNYKTVRKYADTYSATLASFPVGHGLDTTDVQVKIYADGVEVIGNIAIVDDNNLTVSFSRTGTAYGFTTIRIVVEG